jgi:hypothetical protein
VERWAVWKLWRMGVRGKMWRVLKKINKDRKCWVVLEGEEWSE